MHEGKGKNVGQKCQGPEICCNCTKKSYATTLCRWNFQKTKQTRKKRENLSLASYPNRCWIMYFWQNCKKSMPLKWQLKRNKNGPKKPADSRTLGGIASVGWLCYQKFWLVVVYPLAFWDRDQVVDGTTGRWILHVLFSGIPEPLDSRRNSPLRSDQDRRAVIEELKKALDLSSWRIYTIFTSKPK